MRFERKYRIDNLVLQHVQQIVQVHPASFKKIYPDRVVNNIYFDTPQFTCLQDNLNGINIRKKYRLRWYADVPENIAQPQFEVKYKENELGGKKIVKMPDFNLNALGPIQQKVNEVLQGQQILVPTLLNSYNRSYWGTKDQKFRITIDSALKFHPLYYLPKFKKYRILDKAIILELKYDLEDEQQVNRILSHLPFRLSKNSKYVNGILLTQ